MSNPSYPLGRFEVPTRFTPEARAAAIAAIDGLPGELRAAIAGLDDAQLDTPYREGGWTVRQLVHHVADSHVNAYLRSKRTVTEDLPTIHAYDEKVWAEQPEAREADVGTSLALLDGLHRRWVAFLRSLPPETFSRQFVHPERPATMSLDAMVALYAWHGRHHVAHVKALRDQRSW